MLCEKCQANEATVHLTQVVEGAVKKIHFCEGCAAESGFDVQGPVSITDILLGMGGDAEEKVAPSDAAALTCPHCGFQRADFKKSGRLGCPHCYEVFESELVPLLKAMHRNDQHMGKVPEREGLRVRVGTEVAALEKALQEAVGEENFEAAAEYRDRIRKLRDSLQHEEAADAGEN